MPHFSRAGCPILTSPILRRQGRNFDFQYAHVAADAFVRHAKRAAPDEFRSYVISIQFEIVNLVAKQEGKAVEISLNRCGCPTLLA